MTMQFFFIITAIAIVTLVGCAMPPVEHPRTSAPEVSSCCRSVERQPSRNAIVRTAAKLVGAKTIQANGRRIVYDCAGVTRAVFLKHGIDLYDGEPSNPDANGVRIIHEHIEQHGTFHQGPVVHPGDLVFFDNTWDSNGDGKMNDPLTHIGIVERQEPDGTVIFISRVAGAVKRYHMNLGLPHIHKTEGGRILNDYLRRKNALDPTNTRYFAGELFAQFATRVER
jgi:hypothetical protein